MLVSGLISSVYNLIFNCHTCLPVVRWHLAKLIIIPVCDSLVMLDFKFIHPKFRHFESKNHKSPFYHYRCIIRGCPCHESLFRYCRCRHSLGGVFLYLCHCIFRNSQIERIRLFHDDFWISCFSTLFSPIFYRIRWLHV